MNASGTFQKNTGLLCLAARSLVKPGSIGSHTRLQGVCGSGGHSQADTASRSALMQKQSPLSVHITLFHLSLSPSYFEQNLMNTPLLFTHTHTFIEPPPTKTRAGRHSQLVECCSDSGSDLHVKANKKTASVKRKACCIIIVCLLRC